MCDSSNYKNGVACNHELLLLQWRQTGCCTSYTCISHIHSHLQAACYCSGIVFFFFFFFLVKCFAEEHFRRVDYPSVILPKFIQTAGALKCRLPGHRNLFFRRIPPPRKDCENQLRTLSKVFAVSRNALHPMIISTPVIKTRAHTHTLYSPEK